MRRCVTRSIGDVLGEFVAENDFGTRLKEVEAVEHWNELMGEILGRFSRKIHISRGVLTVEISSSVVKAELIMIREELRKRLNERAGQEIVHKIVFR